MVTFNQLLTAVKRYKFRSKWDKGVQLYAIDMIKLVESKPREKILDTSDLEKKLLHYDLTWGYYSARQGLSSERKIAERLLTSKELEEYHTPNKEWDYWDYRKSTRDERMFYEIQTRAIRQAFELIKRTYLALKG
jgi:hypothetical protein